MRIHDNASPDGRYININRPLSADIAAQFKASQQGTAPVCADCGHRMILRAELRDSAWEGMNPLAPNWEAQTEARLAHLRKQVALLEQLGKSKYECTPCKMRRGRPRRTA